MEPIILENIKLINYLQIHVYAFFQDKLMK